jgi:hypothetical protein
MHPANSRKSVLALTGASLFILLRLLLATRFDGNALFPLPLISCLFVTWELVRTKQASGVSSHFLHVTL